jgi:capsular polysaccharide biosynthesis protein
MNVFLKKIKIGLGIVIINSTYYLYSQSERNRFFSSLYSVYKRFLRLIPLAPFELINHKLYAESHLTSSTKTLIENRVGYTSNTVFGMESEDFSLIPIALPSINIYRHKNVRIQGDSDFVINVTDHLAINDFGYNMNNRYENIDGVLYRQKENLAVLKYDGKRCDRTIESGIMISGKFSLNYYHEMYEIMVKLLVLDKTEISDDVPLIVDEVVFKVNSFKQLFESLNRTGRKIIIIGKKEIIEFGTLYCISTIHMIPPNRKNVNDVCSSDVVFDITFLRQMRECLLTNKSDKQFPSKIFISRKNTKNRSYNEDDVVSLVKEYGFSIVAPEAYNFFDQMALFNGADYIIGSSGAAFSNILFCSKGCKIICLHSRRSNISVFTTIAYSLENEMRYCIGTPTGPEIHSSYQVDLDLLEMMLKSQRSNNQ